MHAVQLHVGALTRSANRGTCSMQTDPRVVMSHIDSAVAIIMREPVQHVPGADSLADSRRLWAACPDERDRWCRCRGVRAVWCGCAGEQRCGKICMYDWVLRARNVRAGSSLT